MLMKRNQEIPKQNKIIVKEPMKRASAPQQKDDDDKDPLAVYKKKIMIVRPPIKKSLKALN